MTTPGLINRIASAVNDLVWARQDGVARKHPKGFPEGVNWDALEDWPMKSELKTLLEMERPRNDETKPRVLAHGPHVRGVVASMNELIADHFDLSGTSTPDFDLEVRDRLRRVVNFSLKLRANRNANSAVQTESALDFTRAFLRVAALYHDIGKIIGTDRHVSRGVHLMRDVKDSDRQAFEQGLMEGAFDDKHNFWTLLSHHDVFGCLATGEASLPALSEMVGWSRAQNVQDYHRSPAALVSHLLLLNCADADSSLRFIPGAPDGLRTVEVKRFLDDWEDVVKLLWDSDKNQPKTISREEFKEALLAQESHPERTIERITRFVTTSYRMNMPEDLLVNESEVRTLVEDELAMLHGARLQMFCYLFARFCKIDYGRRFFDVVMLYELLDEHNGLKKAKSELRAHEYPNEKELIVLSKGQLGEVEWHRRRSLCLKGMTRRVCSILKRIVDDYGNSVAGDPRAAPLICVVMANLMPESTQTIAWAICRALAEHESRALAWVSEEVAVSPYAA
jgi:hypothetical protein